MSRSSQSSTALRSSQAVRARHLVAGVLAQYIQDLTRAHSAA